MSPNRYMELSSVVAAAGMAEGMAVLKAHLDVDKSQRKARMEMAEATTVVVLTQDPNALAGFRAGDGWIKPSPEARSALWTDDYANIIGAMWRSFRHSWLGGDR